MESKYREFKNIASSRKKISIESLEEIVDKIKAYDYQLIYYMDRVEIKKKEDELILDPSVIEIRAFGEEGELHLLKKGSLYIGRVIEDNVGEDYEIIDDLYKIWGNVSKNNSNILSEDRGIQIKLPFNVEAGKLLFIKVRHYFTAKRELKNLDWRLIGFEKEDESILREVH